MLSLEEIHCNGQSSSVLPAPPMQHGDIGMTIEVTASVSPFPSSQPRNSRSKACVGAAILFGFLYIAIGMDRSPAMPDANSTILAASFYHRQLKSEAVLDQIEVVAKKVTQQEQEIVKKRRLRANMRQSNKAHQYEIKQLEMELKGLSQQANYDAKQMPF